MTQARNLPDCTEMLPDSLVHFVWKRLKSEGVVIRCIVSVKDRQRSTPKLCAGMALPTQSAQERVNP